MIKIFFMMLFSTILYNCQSINNHVELEFVYDSKDYVLTSVEEKLDLKNNTINIFFEDYFNNNDVKIYFDGKIFFNEKISTDNALGVAGFYLHPDGFDKIDIAIDGKSIRLDKNKIRGFKYLYISKESNSSKIRLLFSNRPHLYQ